MWNSVCCRFSYTSSPDDLKLINIVCINRSDYENGLDYELGSRFAAEEPNYSSGYEGRDVVTDHPFLALKKLLNDGSFYYSLDFNLTDRLQDR